MKAIFKVLGIVFAVVAVLIVAAIIILPRVFDPNDHKDRIEALVLEKTGRVLTVDGDVSLSVFPKLAIKTGHVSFSNPDGGQFGDHKMVEVESASMDVQLIPLLSKSVQAGEVILENPVVRLITLPNGTTNWEDLTSDSDAPRDTVNEAPQPGAASVSDIQIQGVRVSGGSIIWDDQATETRYELNKLHVSTGPIATKRDVALEMSAEVSGSDLPETIAVDIDTHANFQLEGPEVALSELMVRAVGATMEAQLSSSSMVFDGPASILSSPSVTVDAKIDGNDVKTTAQSLVADLGAKKVRIDSVDATLSSGDGSASLGTEVFEFDIDAGEVRIGQTNGQAAFGANSATISLAPWSTRLDQRQFVFDDVKVDADLDGLPAQVLLPSVALDTEAMSVVAEGASVSAEGVRASLDLSAHDLSGDLNYEGRLRLPVSDLRRLAKTLGAYEPSDAEALTAVSAEVDFSGNTSAIDVPLFSATVDQTAIDGSAAVDLSASSYQLKMTADELNIDRYTPAEGSGSSEASGAASDEGVEKAPFVIGELDVNAELAIQRLAMPSADLAVEDLTISAVADATNTLPLTISGLLSGEALPEPLRLDLRGGLESVGDDIQLNEASMSASSDALTASLSTPVVLVPATGPIALNDIAGTFQQADIAANLAVAKLSFESQASTLSLSGLSLDTTVAGVDATATANEATGDLTKQMFELSDIVVQATKNGPIGQINAPVVRIDVAEQVVDAGAMTLTSDAGEASIALRVSEFTSAPRFDGSLQSDGLNVRRLLAGFDFAPEFADQDVLTSVSIDSTIQGSLEAISLEPLELSLDGTPISGYVQILTSPQTSFHYEINAGSIDVDRYIPVSTADQSDVAGYTVGSDDAAVATSLKNLSLNGTINIELLRTGGIDLDDVVVTTQTADGVITVAPISAKLYSGEVAGTVVIDSNGDSPLISAEQQLNNIDVGAALAASGVSEKLVGNGTLVAKINARGLDAASISESMAGTINFDLRNGAVKGFDLQSILVQARRAYEEYKDRETMFEGELEEQTKFSAMTGSLVLDNGIAKNSDLNVEAPLFRISGAGEASLIEQLIDYNLTVNLVKSAEGQGGAQLADLDNIPIPVKIGGSFAQPTFSVDLASLLKDKAKAEVKDKLTEKLKEELGLPDTTEAGGEGKSTRDTITGLLKKKLEQEAGGDETESVDGAAGVDSPPERKHSKDILLDVLNKSIEDSSTPPTTTTPGTESTEQDSAATESRTGRLDDLIQPSAEAEDADAEPRRTTLDGLLGSDGDSAESNAQPESTQDAGDDSANERDQLEDQLKKKLLDKLFN